MKIRTLFASTIALTLMGSAIISQNARADIPMRYSADEGYYFLTVPDTNTTTPAYGGRLRLYDVHIAKMIEISYDECQRFKYPSDHIVPWYYYAGDGKINMGKFDVSCRLANEIAKSYGLGKPERTETGGRPRMIPTFSITGAKVDKWIRFTNNFKPVK
jgi:hypothetical protein